MAQRTTPERKPERKAIRAEEVPRKRQYHFPSALPTCFVYGFIHTHDDAAENTCARWFKLLFTLIAYQSTNSVPLMMRAEGVSATFQVSEEYAACVAVWGPERHLITKEVLYPNMVLPPSKPKAVCPQVCSQSAVTSLSTSCYVASTARSPYFSCWLKVTGLQFFFSCAPR